MYFLLKFAPFVFLKGKLTFILEWLKTTFLQNKEIPVQIIISIIAIIVVWVIRKIILSFFNKNVEDVKKRYRFKKISGNISLILTLIIFIMGIWTEIFHSIITMLGFLSAGIAIALRDLIMAIAGWVYIVLKRPFEVGDRIEFGKTAGDVIDIKLFEFTIIEIGNWVDADQSTGRIVYIPNEQIFKNNIFNYTKAFEYIWNEIPVLITFESNWRKAKSILKRIVDNMFEKTPELAQQSLRRASDKFLIYYSKLTPIVYTSVEASGIKLTVRYLCSPHQRRTSEEELWEAILDKFLPATDINFAYPTGRTIFSRDVAREESDRDESDVKKEVEKDIAALQQEDDETNNP